MTSLWVGIVFGLLYCAKRWSRRQPNEELAPALDNTEPPRRRHHLGDRRRRELANAQARDLVAKLASGRQEPSARPAFGLALQGAEAAYGQARARLETWSRTTTWVTDSRASWWGRRARSVTRELAAEGWRDNGEFTWLLTSARAVGRSVHGGELVPISWASLASADVDARREVVVLNMGNGWSGRLSGPGVLPIALLVVAALHGMEGRLASHGS